MKLLFDLFPLILFFIVFKTHGMFAATAAAMLATFVQVAWAKYRHGAVDKMLWINLGIITIFGGATLLLHDETFIKWKPSVLYWAFSAALLGSSIFFKKNLIQALLGKQITMPGSVWHKLNLAWAAFFSVLGLLNLFVAYTYSTDIWVNFKVFGTTTLMLVFIVAQALALSKYIEQPKGEK